MKQSTITFSPILGKGNIYYTGEEITINKGDIKLARYAGDYKFLYEGYYIVSKNVYNECHVSLIIMHNGDEYLTEKVVDDIMCEYEIVDG